MVAIFSMVNLKTEFRLMRHDGLSRQAPDKHRENSQKDHHRRLFMQPFELEPAVDTLEDVAALLRKRGNVLVDEGALPSSSLSLQ